MGGALFEWLGFRKVKIGTINFEIWQVEMAAAGENMTLLRGLEKVVAGAVHLLLAMF